MLVTKPVAVSLGNEVMHPKARSLAATIIPGQLQLDQLLHPSASVAASLRHRIKSNRMTFRRFLILLAKPSFDQRIDVTGSIAANQ
jgi:hypothetical protein